MMNNSNLIISGSNIATHKTLRINGRTLEQIYDSSALEGADKDAMDAEFARILLCGYVAVHTHDVITVDYLAGIPMDVIKLEVEL